MFSNIGNLVKSYVARRVETSTDRDLYRRVESLKKETWEKHLEDKKEQKEDILKAAEQTGSEIETKKLEEIAQRIEREKQRAAMEVKVRQNHLQTLVDVQAGSK